MRKTAHDTTSNRSRDQKAAAGVRTVVVGEVTTLAHEAGNDTVEDGSLVAVSLLARAESAEVLGRLGDDIGAQLHDDAALWTSEKR